MLPKCHHTAKFGRAAPQVPCEMRERIQHEAGTQLLGDLYMGDQLSPAFHAEIILEFFNEYECFRKVSERTSILLSSSSP
jgi:hypothetical protein